MSDPKLFKSPFVKPNLTKVFGSRAIVVEDCDHTGPEHLQGGYVGRKDAECTSKRGHINLFHAGLFEKHLENGDGMEDIFTGLPVAPQLKFTSCSTTGKLQQVYQ